MEGRGRGNVMGRLNVTADAAVWMMRVVGFFFFFFGLNFPHKQPRHELGEIAHFWGVRMTHVYILSSTLKLALVMDPN